MLTSAWHSSLQEVAPLSYSFIGSYFLNPYLARYEDALNLAAARCATEEPEQDVVSVTPTPKTYTLVRSQNVGMTVLMLFSKNPAALHHIQEAEVGFGAAEMGNKGAAGVRVTYGDTASGKSTELTFVATHLAAMEWNLPRRNANWAAIMRGLTFENPEDILRPTKALPEPERLGPTRSGDASDEFIGLLHDEHHAHSLELQRRLQDISVFKPSSHLFVAGDLNYRISTTSPPPLATFPSLDPDSESYYPRFFALDQLTREKAAGRTLHGMEEAEVGFPPTYKYVVLPQEVDETLEMDVPWVFAPHRYPSWTDRILYLDIPAWARDKGSMDVRSYDCLPVIRTSDHRPVFLRVSVPLLSAEDMEPPASASQEDAESVNPRLTLPVAIDPEAWGRRAAARRREVMAGWSMFLWSTKQGALVLATVLLFGISGWWLLQGW
jgi:hypothetical protein